MSQHEVRVAGWFDNYVYIGIAGESGTEGRWSLVTCTNVHKFTQLKLNTRFETFYLVLSFDQLIKFTTLKITF